MVLRIERWNSIDRGWALALRAFRPHISFMRIKPLFLFLPVGMVLGACASTPTPPRPILMPTRAPTAPPFVASAPLQAWVEAPLTSGFWVYLGNQHAPGALFGVPGTPAQFALRCDRARGVVLLQRLVGPPPASGAVMTLATSSTQRSYPAVSLSWAANYLTAEIPAQDPILDAMAFSRGRFAVAIPGQGTLVLPSWVEVTRVVEDCRT